jgi:hypothetical protein
MAIVKPFMSFGKIQNRIIMPIPDYMGAFLTMGFHLNWKFHFI